MHFLMPHVFQSHKDFKEWFSNPLSGMIEGSREYNEGLIKRLHKVNIRVMAATETTQGTVTLGNLSFNSSRKFVARDRDN